LILGGIVMTEKRQKILGAGFDAYQGKPIR